jgi:hypothetical protein
MLASLGFFSSHYMSTYELKRIPYPWDPFFGDGTRRVLDPKCRRCFPSPMPASVRSPGVSESMRSQPLLCLFQSFVKSTKISTLARNHLLSAPHHYDQREPAPFWFLIRA